MGSRSYNKIHYDNQSDTFKLSSGKDLEIDNIPRHQEHKLSLVDIGIGMTKADLTPNLGAIAKPGTKMFVENLQPSADMSMIGAGFVSAYLVVQKVVVITKQKHTNPNHPTMETLRQNTKEDKNEKAFENLEVLLFANALSSLPSPLRISGPMVMVSIT
ncbi:hypothetical protein ACRRTK_002020 [Alexandromys fortis]